MTDESTIEFEGKNAVIRSEDLSNLWFKNVPVSISLEESTPEGEIRVEASEDLDDLLLLLCWTIWNRNRSTRNNHRSTTSDCETYIDRWLLVLSLRASKLAIAN